MTAKEGFDRLRELGKKYQDKASKSIKDMRKRRRECHCD